jgi:two-component system LytT family response regulator
MRVLIIEDETPAVRNLRSLLRTVEPLAEIAGITDSVSSSIGWLKENNTPDLIFMDIHLADGDAFLIFEQTTVSSPVIFTTAYDRYALDAFRVNSIDYLLKPIQADDLKRALDKLKRLTHLELETYLHRTHQSVLHKSPLKNFLVPVRDKILPLSVADIAYCHTAGEKVSAYTFDGRSYQLDMSLEIICTRLPEEDFFRANRQFVVARSAIADMAVWYGNRLSINLTVSAPERIIVSKSRVSLLKRWLAGT